MLVFKLAPYTFPGAGLSGAMSVGNMLFALLHKDIQSRQGQMHNARAQKPS